jgi:hypothetical protein
MLYRSIALSVHESFTPPGCLRIGIHKRTRLVATIIQLNPSLARHIRTFVYAPGRYDESFIECLGASLKLMVNLEGLTIVNEAGCSIPLTSVLASCTFQLESFQLSDSSHFPFPKTLEYLSTQPRLKRLRLEWPLRLSPLDDRVFPESSCPELTFLAGSTLTVARIAPNRPISHLILEPELSDKHKSDSALLRAFNNLHTLCIRSLVPAHVRSLLPDLKPQLRRLQVLHLSTFITSVRPLS